MGKENEKCEDAEIRDWVLKNQVQYMMGYS